MYHFVSPSVKLLDDQICDVLRSALLLLGFNSSVSPPAPADLSETSISSVLFVLKSRLDSVMSATAPPATVTVVQSLPPDDTVPFADSTQPLGIRIGEWDGV